MHAPDRVVIVVFDGLRPDHVRPDLTPNILRLAARGTTHARAHSVFPSLTRVATTSISSGAPPRVHGVMGNAFWHFGAFADRAIDTSRFADLARLIETDPRGVVTAETLGERLAKAGKSMAVVHSGSAGSAFLINPKVRENGHWTFSIHGRDFTATPSAVDDMVARFGPLPEPALPRFPQMDRATDVFVDHVLAERRPDVALMWLPEPDTSYHYREIASADSLAALRHADACFGRVLDAVDLDAIAVLVLSDHGQITVNEEVPLYDRLRSAGFDAATKGADVTIVGTSGASGEIRLRAPDAALRDRVAAFLGEQPEIGMVFSRGRNEVEGEAPGTLALDVVDLWHDRAPDLAFVLRSTTDDDHHGLPGLGLYMGGVPLNGGMHGGLNRHELATVLIAGGAGIASAGRVDAPAGLPDIAPTVLALLGVPAPESMTGRVLWEALGRVAEEDEPREEVVATALGGAGDRVQALERVAFAGRRYLVSGGLA
jgi:arylsulfatase A-like enzyme